MSRYGFMPLHFGGSCRLGDARSLPESAWSSADYRRCWRHYPPAVVRKLTAKLVKGGSLFVGYASSPFGYRLARAAAAIGVSRAARTIGLASGELPNWR